MQKSQQLELPGLNLTDVQMDQLLLFKPEFRLNRAQQMLLLVAGLFLLMLLLFPPWMTPINGEVQFLGFYSIFGNDAQAALHAGSAPVFLYTGLLGLLALQISLITLFLFGALALTREDWAATISHFLHNAAIANTAEDFLESRKTQSVRLHRPLHHHFFRPNPGHVVTAEVEEQERSIQLERQIVKRAMELVARGHSRDAEALLRRSLHQASFLEGEETPFAAELAFRLANLLRDRGETAEAEEMYIASIETYERTLGLDDQSLASVLLGYARLLYDIQRSEPARRLEEDAKRIRHAFFQQGTIRVAGDSPVVLEERSIPLPHQHLLQSTLNFLE